MAVAESLGKTLELLKAQAVVGIGPEFIISQSVKSVQATLHDGVLSTSTVIVEGSNNPALLGWVSLGSLNLSGSGDTGLVPISNSMVYIRARVGAIAGGGNIDVVMSV